MFSHRPTDNYLTNRYLVTNSFMQAKNTQYFVLLQIGIRLVCNVLPLGVIFDFSIQESTKNGRNELHKNA